MVDNQFTSAIMHLNEQMIDAKTGGWSSTRKAWVETIKAFKLERYDQQRFLLCHRA